MKATREKIAVMQAYADGKKIEFDAESKDVWESWESREEPNWNWEENDYRIKPEPKYRPYKYAGECFADVKKHGGWIRAKHFDEYFHIGCSGDGFVIMVASGDKNSMNGNVAESFEELLENNVWADDGTPCGILKK